MMKSKKQGILCFALVLSLLLTACAQKITNAQSAALKVSDKMKIVGISDHYKKCEGTITDDQIEWDHSDDENGKIFIVIDQYQDDQLTYSIYNESKTKPIGYGTEVVLKEKTMDGWEAVDLPGMFEEVQFFFYKQKVRSKCLYM